MPDTTIARQTRSANAQRSRFLLAEWRDAQKPALDKIIDGALDLLHALDAARVGLMLADDIKAVDAFACDTAGQTIDLLNRLLATQRRELDDCGGDEDDMRLDLSALEDEHMGWETRWNARRPAALKVL
jgi:hypothetical protein